MQTIYYSTPNFIQHNNNIVDLNEYRRKLAVAEEGSLAPQPEAEYTYDFPWAKPQLREEQPALRELPRPSRRARRERRAWVLDACASLSVVVMTLTFTLHVLL